MDDHRLDIRGPGVQRDGAGGVKTTVDTKEIEDVVRERTAALGLRATKVTCPRDVEPTG